MYHWQVCSPIQWVILLFWWWFLYLCRRFLIWCNTMCLLFPLFFLPCKIQQQKIFLYEISEILIPKFSCKMLWFHDYIYVFYPYWVYSCIGSKLVVYFQFFADTSPVFPTWFIEKPVKRLQYMLLPLLSNIIWLKCCRLISGLCVPFHWSICLFLC